MEGLKLQKQGHRTWGLGTPSEEASFYCRTMNLKFMLKQRIIDTFSKWNAYYWLKCESLDIKT